MSAAIMQLTQFQTANAYVGTALSELLADWWELSKCQYQGW
jgi:hypothetical protein